MFVATGALVTGIGVKVGRGDIVGRGVGLLVGVRVGAGDFVGNFVG